MPDYKFVVFTNCAEGSDEEFNRWYDHRHLPDVLAVPGFIGAQRARATVHEPPPRHRYLAIYDIRSDDVGATIAELMGRAGSDRMPMTQTMTEVETLLYEVMEPPPGIDRHEGGSRS